MKLRLATAQFPVSADIDANAEAIRSQMREAKAGDARVVHFCEGALSGYAGVDFESFRDFDWTTLRARSKDIAQLAGELGLWVILGSSHRLSGHHKPHNSLYIIDDRGTLVDRYDKMFCAGREADDGSELIHFSPGDHLCTFVIDGVRCGVLICHEYRYPELYREYKKRDVQLMFHSFHAANVDAKTLAFMREQVGGENHRYNPGTTLPEITMPATMHAAAASSHIWISAANSSAPESCWPSFFVRADGVITGKLQRNLPGLLFSTVDTDRSLYDSTEPWRARAMTGVLHSGRLVDDERSLRRDRF